MFYSYMSILVTGFGWFADGPFREMGIGQPITTVSD